MKERLIQFLPSLAILLGIAVIISLYLARLMKRFERKDIVDDEEWIKWVKTKKIRLFFLIANILNLNICAPITEELIFRAPLIVLFSKLSYWAYLSIGLSGILFAIMHCFTPNIFFCDLDKALNRSRNLEDLGKEIDRDIKHRGKIIKGIKIAKIIPMFVLGTTSGYFGIKYQSIYLSAGIHIGWNLILSIIAVNLTYLIARFYWWVKDAIRDRKFARIKNNKKTY